MSQEEIPGIHSLVQTMFLTRTEEYGDDASPQICCPLCGYRYVHMEKPFHFVGGNYEVAHAFGMDVRGDVTAIPFWGECGHKWVLSFGFHKGYIFYGLIPKEWDGVPEP